MVILGVAPGCGGGAPEPQAPDGASDEPTSKVEPSEREHSASGSESEESTAPAKTTCDDGTCSPCGDGQCPAGWYCDEGGKGGPACGWLPECAKKPSCACVKRALPGSCEERGGGIYVKAG